MTHFSLLAAITGSACRIELRRFLHALRLVGMTEFWCGSNCDPSIRLRLTQDDRLSFPKHSSAHAKCGKGFLRGTESGCGSTLLTVPLSRPLSFSTSFSATRERNAVRAPCTYCYGKTKRKGDADCARRKCPWGAT